MDIVGLPTDFVEKLVIAFVPITKGVYNEMENFHRFMELIFHASFYIEIVGAGFFIFRRE